MMMMNALETSSLSLEKRNEFASGRKFAQPSLKWCHMDARAAPRPTLRGADWLYGNEGERVSKNRQRVAR